VRQLVKDSQVEFWAVNMGEPPEYDPIHETEYLALENIITADQDGSLRYLASTYDPQSDRMFAGTSMKGPRVLTFAPLLKLKELPFNDLMIALLTVCQKALGDPVEIEFAMTFNPHRFGFLQVRPMVVSTEKVHIEDQELVGENVLFASEHALGNGVNRAITDVVYVKPEGFEMKHTREIVPEIEYFNRKMLEEGLPYLLIAIGRLGTTDPWLGIPRTGAGLCSPGDCRGHVGERPRRAKPGHPLFPQHGELRCAIFSPAVFQPVRDRLGLAEPPACGRGDWFPAARAVGKTLECEGGWET